MMHQIAFGPPLTRAEQRRLQLLEIEMEQRREEQEAMGITEEQRQILLHTFKSVKVEFSDLDGLKWTPAALSTRQRTRPRPKPLPLTTHNSLNLPTKPCPKRKGAHSAGGASSRTPMASPYETPLRRRNRLLGRHLTPPLCLRHFLPPRRRGRTAVSYMGGVGMATIRGRRRGLSSMMKSAGRFTRDIIVRWR